MRVISGILKGRTIKGYDMDGTRPTMDRLKESLFAMIQTSVNDSICLDLFAGSGALGIEAISNGASLCYFIDNSNDAYKTVLDNIKTFKIEDKSKVLKLDYRDALKHFKENKIKFNLIFIDPPYKDKNIPNILSFISNNNLLYPKGQVICELSGYDLTGEYSNLDLVKRREYGDKIVYIYVNNDKQ